MNADKRGEKMNKGKLTAKMARILGEKFKGRADILFDLGNPKTDGADKVGIIRSWFGSKLTRGSLLANLDMAVVLPKPNQVVALIEIEESAANAKTLLGDVFATLFGDHITFRGKPELKVDAQTILIVLACSSSHRQVASYLNQTLRVNPDWRTKNSRIGRVVIDAFRTESELEEKLTNVIENALARRQSKI
jgi:hypothetical protein